MATLITEPVMQSALTRHAEFIKAADLTALVLTNIAAQKRLTTQAALTALSLLTCIQTSAQGVHIAFEFAHLPDTPAPDGLNEPNLGRLIYLYIGLQGAGIVAQYAAASGTWTECQSHGNYGNNPASGGTWTATTKHKPSLYTPPLVQTIIQTLIKQTPN